MPDKSSNLGRNDWVAITLSGLISAVVFYLLTGIIPQGVFGGIVVAAAVGYYLLRKRRVS